MEILSLANTELDEKIEQELIDNPVLEKQTEGPEVDQNQPKEKEKEGQQELLIEDNTNNADDFERLFSMNVLACRPTECRKAPTANTI